VLSLGELRDMLREHSREYSHFAEHARFLDGCGARARARAPVPLPCDRPTASAVHGCACRPGCAPLQQRADSAAPHCEAGG